MNKKTLIKAGLVLGGCVAVYMIADHYKKDYDQGEIMLKVASNATVSEKGLDDGLMGIPEIDAISEKYDIKDVSPVFEGMLPEGYNGELARWYHLEFSEGTDVEGMIKEYQELGSLVEVAQLDMIYQASDSGILSALVQKAELEWEKLKDVLGIKGPNDPLWEKQWGMHRIKAVEAREAFPENNNPRPIIAVLDSGVYQHEDLEGMFARDKSGKVIGHNMISNSDKWQDDNGHGTHVATIMAMVWNNGKGGAGVGHIYIMPVKALSAWGSGTSEGLAKGLIWAANNGAFAINNSWGSSWPTSLVEDAGEYCVKKGVLLTAAAGNSNTGKRHYPAGYDEFLAVGAMTVKDQRAEFSNYGDYVKIAAPGKDIWAGYLGEYKSLSGTSMADPFVTGAAGEVKYQHPKATAEQVRKLLIDEKSTDAIKTDKPIGGCLNLLKLLQNAEEALEE